MLKDIMKKIDYLNQQIGSFNEKIKNRKRDQIEIEKHDIRNENFLMDSSVDLRNW